MYKPLVSVIIACKNNEEYIDKSLQSVINQTYKNIELIIIDNYSTDRTFEIARKYTNKVYQLGPERSTQFNYGFKKSKGELIYRIGAEFVLEKDVVEKCVKKIKEGYDALALHNRSIGDSVWAKVRFIERESYINSNRIVAVRFMKRKVFESVGMFDEELVAGEDFDLHNRIVGAGYKWCHIDAIEDHIGEPKTIKEVWNKFYYYGQTIQKYKKKNKDIAQKQFIFFRPCFKKIKKEIKKSLKLYIAFYIYLFTKYLACFLGSLKKLPDLKIIYKKEEKKVNNSWPNGPLVSIIVPSKNSSRFLGNCLKSIKNQTYKNIEIIVVDNNSTDNTKEIAKKFTNKVYNKEPERSAQRNFGINQSNGEYIIIIDSDMILSRKIIEDCIKKMQTDRNIKAIIIPEESFGKGFWTQCKKLERSFYIGVDWMEAARFFDKKTFIEFKGYDESNTGTEDYDLPQRIENKYGKKSIHRIEDLIYHDEGKITLLETCRKKFYYAQTLDSYKKRKANIKKYKKQSSILVRHKLFFSQPRKLLKNPILGFGIIFMKTCEFAFGGAGYLTEKIKKIWT